MKRILLSLLLLVSFSAKANIWDSFDLQKFIEGSLLIGESISESLEKAREWQHKKMDVQTQWTTMCETTLALNKSVEAFAELMDKHQVDQKICLPATQALKLQVSLLNKCHDFYNNRVPSNAEYAVNQFSDMMFASGEILLKCYPSLTDFLPMF